MKDFWQSGIKKACKRLGKTLPELEKEWLARLATLDASAIQYPVQ